MFKTLTIRKKLVIFFLLLSLIPFMLVSLLSIYFFSKNIERQAFNQLVSIRDVKFTQLQDYFERVEEQIQDFVARESTKKSIIRFNKIFKQLEADGKTAEEMAQTRYVPGSEDQLQKLVGKAKPSSGDEIAKVYGPYGRIHQLYHPYYRQLVYNSDFKDIFLINIDGLIIYSQKKEQNYGTNLVHGKFSHSSLATVYGKIIQYGESDQFEPTTWGSSVPIFFEDFQIDPATNTIVSYLAVPLVSSGYITGVLAFQLSSDKINAIMGERSGLGETGETYLVGADLRMRSDSFLDFENYSSQASFANPEKGKVSSEAIDQSLEGNTGIAIHTSYLGNEAFSAYRPLQVYETQWAIVAELSEDEANENSHQLQQIMIVMGLISSGLILGIAILFSNSIVKPILNIANRLDDIASGEGDLTQRIMIERKDEIGKLAFGFNQFVKKIQDIIQDIQGNANHLASASQELSRTAIDMQQYAEKMTDSIESEAAANAQSAATITEMVRSLEHMFNQIKAIQSITDTAGERAHEGTMVVKESNQTISSIEDDQKKIEGITQVITEIANQTQLLSLNAAIEAAKAGDFGKGFVVVADEVRSLSERSAKAVVEIRDSVSESSTSIEKGAKVIYKTQSVFGNIIEQVQDITSNINELSIAATEQETAMQEIATGMEQVSQSSEENATSSKQLLDLLHETGHTIENLSDIADQLMNKVDLFKV